jgi:uncharacterized protein YicC (UPF0701 family)
VADILRIATNEDKKPHDYSEELLKLAKNALKELMAAREREGARLAQMLLDRTAQLRSLAALAVPMVPKLVEQQKNRFWSAGRRPWPCPTAPPCRKSPRTGR